MTSSDRPKSTNPKSLSGLLPFLRPYRGRIGLALLFLVLAGVAVMIGTLQDQHHWILLLVPSIPLLMAVVALMVALRKTHHSPVCTIRQQFIADVAAFTGPAAKNHEK